MDRTFALKLVRENVRNENLLSGKRVLPEVRTGSRRHRVKALAFLSRIL